jgi:DNA-binding MarR family transcriptional regulator
MEQVDGVEPEVRWLNAAQLAAWLELAGVLMRLPGALEAQLQRDADLSQFEYLVLAHLSESDRGQIRMSELAAMANGSLSRLSHVVARLERRGYVERRPCQDDGRATNAVLTPSGRDKLAAAAPGHVAAVRELVVDALTPPELQALHAACARIAARLDARDGSCGGAGGATGRSGTPCA